MSEEAKRYHWSAHGMVERVLGAFVAFSALDDQAEEHERGLITFRQDIDEIHAEEVRRLRNKHAQELEAQAEEHEKERRQSDYGQAVQRLSEKHSSALAAQAEEHAKDQGEISLNWVKHVANTDALHADELSALREQVEDLKEVIWPFALYATALKGREAMNTVHRIGHQAITVSAFREAREILKLDETPEEKSK